MSEVMFKRLIIAVAALFIVFFCITVIPALIQDPDVIGAFAAGFVNPYASGYSTDVILCWVVLAIWVVFERKQYSIKHGWVSLLLDIVPGVVVGLALYLWLRQRHFKSAST